MIVTSTDRILIFGGSFDPPHRAHIELPVRVAKSLNCQRVIYVPARLNPLKSEQPLPGTDRVAMLRAALENHANVEVSTIELDRAGASFFIDTLDTLITQHPQATWLFLIGCDQALEFHRWREWERILTLAQPVVMLRPPWTRDSLRAALAAKLGDTRANWWINRLADESLPRIDVSATMIRKRLAKGESIDDLVSPAVARYIRAHRLYG